MTYAPDNTQTLFLNQSEVFPEETDDFLLKMTTVYNYIANNVNAREIGIYDLVENINGQFWFDATDAQNKRLGFRQVYNTGALAAGVNNIAHGLTGITFYTFIGGTCTTVADSRPIPYVDIAALANQISVAIIGANIVVTVGAGVPAITASQITLEYLKN